MIGRQGNVCRQRLTHRLAVLIALRHRKHLEVPLDRIRNVIQNSGTLGGGAFAPFILSRMRRVERELDVVRT